MDVNWHFGSIALAHEIGEFAEATVKWYQAVVDTDDDGEYDSYLDNDGDEGRSNNPGNTTSLEFRLKLTKGLRTHD